MSDFVLQWNVMKKWHKVTFDNWMEVSSNICLIMNYEILLVLLSVIHELERYELLLLVRTQIFTQVIVVSTTPG